MSVCVIIQIQQQYVAQVIIFQCRKELDQAVKEEYKPVLRIMGMLINERVWKRQIIEI